MRRPRAAQRRAWVTAAPSESAVLVSTDRVEPARPGRARSPFEVAQLLGDPKPDIGGAGDEGRIGMPCIERRQGSIERGRREEALLVADEDVISPPSPASCRPCRRAARANASSAGRVQASSAASMIGR